MTISGSNWTRPLRPKPTNKDNGSYNLTRLPKKITLADVRALRPSGQRMAMLTCYDFTMARMMHEAGVPLILVGDSAASVVLGHDTTLPVDLAFMIDIT